MNGLRLPQSMLNDPNKTNIFELREETYKNIQAGMLKYLDDMFSVCEPDKQREILERKPEVKPLMNTFYMFYKGVEIPIFDKTQMILDGIEYIPTLQIVDKPIHSQKNGKFIVVKTNMRFCLIKMSGQNSMVMTKTGSCPLLVYMMYLYNADIGTMLIDLGYELTDKESEATYFIPDLGNSDRNTIIMVKECKKGSWKDYFLSPYTKDNLEWHQKIIDMFIKETEVYSQEEEDEKKPDSTSIASIRRENAIANANKNNQHDDSDTTSIENKKSTEEYLFTTDEASKLELLRKENLSLFEKNLINKISCMIYCYFISTKRNKRVIKKSHIATTLHKFITKDMTLEGVSILGMVKNCVSEDIVLPEGISISDLSQKMIRYLEWYALKLISVRSYPEKSMITQVAKVEPKLVYDNCCNPLSELAILSRGNLFGKGGMPRESCQAQVRNINQSYFGIIDPIDSPSGANIGISLHVVPEIQSFDFEEDMKHSDESNLFSKSTK